MASLNRRGRGLSNTRAALLTMYRQGLVGGSLIFLPEDTRIPLTDNSLSNILSELDGKSFAESLQKGIRLRGATNIVPPCKLIAFWDTYGLSLQMACRSNVPADDLHLLSELVERYACLRLGGHTRIYSLLSLESSQAASPSVRVAKEPHYLIQKYHIPPNWLQKSTNDNTYFVVDGPIAWVYEPNTGEVTRKDAKEFDPAFKAVLDDAYTETLATIGTVGGSRAFYREVQRLLKRKYGLYWISSPELNGRVQTDMAPIPPKH